MLVADYSNGRLSAAQLRAAGFGGAARYLRKRQPSSVVVLNAAEVQDFVVHGFPFTLIYEDAVAGWMTGGESVGFDRGLWALTQARACGVEPRCILFADDSQHPDEAGRLAVYACLRGARRAVREGGVMGGMHVPPARYGADVAGFYGFRDTMRGVAAEGLTRYRWLTGTRPSGDEVRQLGLTMYQRNYGDRPTVAGVQLDVNDTLAPDWGQVPYADAGPKVGTETEDYDMFYMEVAGRPGVLVGPGFVQGVPSAAVRDALRAAGVPSKPVTVEQYDTVVNFMRPTEVAADVQQWATDRHDASAATLREVLQQWPAMREAVTSLKAGGGQVDTDALAEKVADLLAARLAQ